MSIDGGGASRSTEPASGSSAATDVSLHAHLLGVIAAERALTNEQINGVAAMAKAMRERDIAAVTVAFEANESLTTAHNGLLRKMELQGEQFATREALDRRIKGTIDLFDAGQKADDARFKRLETWQARLTGGLLLLSAVGVSNLIKIWGS